MAKLSTPSVEAPVADIVAEEATPVVAPAGGYIVLEGDSYASIADKHKPAKMTKHDYAVELYEKNGGKALAAGVIVNL